MQEYIWQILAISLMFITLITIIIIHRLQGKRKSLTYDIESITPLVNIKDGILSGIEITHNGKPIEDVYMITIRFFNSGNQPITTNDYEEKVKIIHNKDAKALSAEVYNPEPKNLELMASPNKNMVELHRALLNAGDAFSLKIFTSNFDINTKIAVNGRIIGIKNIQEKREPTRQEAAKRVSIIVGTTIFLAIMISFIIYPASINVGWVFSVIVFASLGLVFLLELVFFGGPKKLK